jgi:hypothetical protein
LPSRTSAIQAGSPFRSNTAAPIPKASFDKSGPDPRRGYRLSARVFTPRLHSSAFSQRGFVTMLFWRHTAVITVTDGGWST